MIFKLVGLILPPVIDLINSKVLDSRLRFIVAFVFCAVVGILVHVINNGYFISADAVASDILTVFALSQVTYQLVYGDSKMQAQIRSL